MAADARKIYDEAEISPVEKANDDEYWKTIEETIKNSAKHRHSTVRLIIGAGYLNFIISTLVERGFKIINIDLDSSNGKYYILVNFSAEPAPVPEVIERIERIGQPWNPYNPGYPSIGPRLPVISMPRNPHDGNFYLC